LQKNYIHTFLLMSQLEYGVQERGSSSSHQDRPGEEKQS